MTGEKRFARLALFACLALSLSARAGLAVTVIAGDVNEDPALPAQARADWEAAALAREDADELLIEDFEAEPPRLLFDGDNSVGLVGVFLDDAQKGHENRIVDPSSVNGSRGLAGAVRNPNAVGPAPDPNFIRIDFPEPVVAFGADYVFTIGLARLTVTAESELILFGDYLNQPPAQPGVDPPSGSGFLGLVFDAPVSEVTFGVEGAGTFRNQQFGLDDLSFVTATPLPFTVFSGDANEDPGLPAAARADWEAAALEQKAAAILVEDFESVPVFRLVAGDNDIGLVSAFLDRNDPSGETQIADQTSPNGSRGLVGAIDNPNAPGAPGTDPTFIRIDFPQPALGFAADYTGTIGMARLTLTALGAEVRFGDYLVEAPPVRGGGLPDGSGFLGLVFDAPVSQVVLRVEGDGMDPNQVFELDDLSLAAVPSPSAGLGQLAALASLLALLRSRRTERPGGSRV